MTNRYVAVVAMTVAAHLAYLLYVPCGGFLAFRWPRTMVVHVPAVAWGIGVVILRLECPLTSLESWARRRANMDPLPASGFIDRYVTGYFVPPGGVGVAQTLAFASAALSWGVLARQGIGRRRHRMPTAG